MWSLTRIRRNAENLYTQGEDPIIVAAESGATARFLRAAEPVVE